MPCSRCVLPPSTTIRPSRAPDRQSRPPQPILLEDKYLLLEELGRGGMGTVFRAQDRLLERSVAIKFLLPEVQAIAAAVERFRREARAMAKINHQNVVRVFSFGRYGAADFLVTEFIDGQSLEQMIATAQRRRVLIALDQALELLLQAAAGLVAVHRAGVVHRDIKPGNVMVESSTMRVLIMDFGIGRDLTPGSGATSFVAGGTPAYMAPETIGELGQAPVDERLIDLYALGVTAFELLTGQLPFEAETWIELLEKHLEEEPVPPSLLRPEIPPELDGVILRCLAKEPEARYGSVEELRGALLEVARALRGRERHSNTPSPRPTIRPRPEPLGTRGGRCR